MPGTNSGPSFGTKRARGTLRSGLQALPLLVAGTKVAALGDSIVALANVATTSSVRTTSDNRGIGELTVARARNPRIRHWNWWDIGATNALRGGTYTDVTGANADTFRSGANYGYSGDTVNGITKRRTAVLNSLCDVVFIAAGTNTDSPNTAANKITKLDAEITAYRAAGKRVILATVRPRSSGDRETLNNVLTTTLNNGTVTLTRAAHGLTNTSAATKQVEFIAPGVTIAGITLSGIITSGTGGWTVNVVDVNTITFTSATLANAAVTNGGGSFTWHRNFFTSTLGLTAVGLCVMPSSTVWAEHDLLNAWILAQSARSGVYVWDNRAVYRDAALSTTTGVYLEIDKSLTNDGVHPNHKGAQLAGISLDAVIDGVIATGTWFDSNPTTGNLLTNPAMATATGGTIGASCTGTLPANTSIANVAGAAQPVTCVASVEANGDGTNSAVLTISSTGAGAANSLATMRFSGTAVTTGIATTDWVSFLVRARVTTPHAILIGMQATIGQTSTISNYGMRTSGAADVRDPYITVNTAVDWTIETEPLLYEARTNVTPRLDMYVRQDVAGTCVIKIPMRKIMIVGDVPAAFPWSPT
jgi:lysophospholipase L1-like esterase